MSSFIRKLPLFQRKMFISGCCPEITIMLDKILTDDQKNALIHEVDECYRPDFQEQIISKFEEKTV